MGTTTIEVISSGPDFPAILDILIVFGPPTLVFLVFGIWAIRSHPDGGAVKAVGVVLTALGVILAVFLVVALLFGGFPTVLSETTFIEGVP